MKLLSSDAAHGASVGAGTAVDALVAVDGVMAEVIVHRDGFVGAGLAAGTAGDAAIVNNVHGCYLLVFFPRGD